MAAMHACGRPLAALVVVALLMTGALAAPREAKKASRLPQTGDEESRIGQGTLEELETTEPAVSSLARQAKVPVRARMREAPMLSWRTAYI